MSITSGARDYWAIRIAYIIDNKIQEIKDDKILELNKIVDAEKKNFLHKHGIAGIWEDYHRLKNELKEVSNAIDLVIKAHKPGHSATAYSDTFDDILTRIAKVSIEEIIFHGPYKEVNELNTLNTFSADKLQNADTVKEVRSVLAQINKGLKKHKLETLVLEL